ncbi:hypothetical protein ACFX14_007820 [Malus domestica]
MEHGLPQIDLVDDVCEDCQFVASFGGNLYVITFIDDFSRKVWVYFLKEKSEAFQAFKDFKAEVEKFVSLPIKSLRTDCGGEYLSNEFQKYCRDHGIKH